MFPDDFVTLLSTKFHENIFTGARVVSCRQMGGHGECDTKEDEGEREEKKRKETKGEKESIWNAIKDLTVPPFTRSVLKLERDVACE
jgi:hypothetical protein